MPERFQGIFDRGDENKDGSLTPEELRKMAAAQSPPTASEGPGGRGGGRGDGPRGQISFVRMDPVLAAVDADGDGIISAEEIRNSAHTVRKLDKNEDGKVTPDEVSGPGRGF